MLKGGAIPPIHPLVDVNNLLSIRLAVPCGMLAEAAVAPPFVHRAGREGEAYESFRGHLDLKGKPLLADSEGPLDTPIASSRRGSIEPDTTRAWLVVNLPAREVSADQAHANLEELLRAAPVARIRTAGATA